MYYAAVFIWGWRQQNVIVSNNFSNQLLGGVFLPDMGRNTPSNNWFDKLFDIRRFYVFSPVLIQNLFSPALFSHCPALSLFCAVLSSSILFFSPMMNVNAAIAASWKNLGDLSKNTPEVNYLMLAILRAVERVVSHKATGRKQSVSLCYY